MNDVSEGNREGYHGCKEKNRERNYKLRDGMEKKRKRDHGERK